MFGKSIPERSIFWHYPLYLQGRGLTIDVPSGGTYSWRGFPSTSLRRGDWKLIEFWEYDDVELYDLSNDIGEQNDLSKQHPEKVRELQLALNNWRTSIGAVMPARAKP